MTERLYAVCSRHCGSRQCALMYQRGPRVTVGKIVAARSEADCGSCPHEFHTMNVACLLRTRSGKIGHVGGTFENGAGRA